MSFQSDFIRNKRAKQIKDREAADKKYGHLGDAYKREVFEWEKPGYNAVSTGPISQEVLKADPSIVTADKPRILTPAQIQSNIDKSDPVKRAEAIAKAQAVNATKPGSAEEARVIASQKNNGAVTVPSNVVNNTAEQLRKTLLQAEEKKKLADLTRATDKATSAVEVRKEGIEPRIKGLKSQASVATQVGQKRLKDLFAATGAAVGTGAAKQIASEQGLQSQLGALDVQKSQELADVDRDLADIQSEKAFIERQIQAGTATAESQAQLEALQAQQEAQAKAAEINSEREFQIFENNLKQFNEMELINLKNSLEQDNTVLDAEIQRLRDSQLFEQDSLLKQQSAIEAERLQGIKNSNALKLAGINNAADLAQQRLRGQQSQSDILLRDSLQTQADSVITPNQSAIDASLKNYLGDTEFLSEDAIKQRSLEWITRNEDTFIADPQLLVNIMTRNNISKEDLQKYEEWRDNALNAGIFE